MLERPTAKEPVLLTFRIFARREVSTSLTARPPGGATPPHRWFLPGCRRAGKPDASERAALAAAMPRCESRAALRPRTVCFGRGIRVEVQPKHRRRPRRVVKGLRRRDRRRGPSETVRPHERFGLVPRPGSSDTAEGRCIPTGLRRSSVETSKVSPSSLLAGSGASTLLCGPELPRRGTSRAERWPAMESGRGSSVSGTMFPGSAGADCPPPYVLQSPQLFAHALPSGVQS